MTDYKTRPPTAIHQDSAATYQWLRTTPLAILCGRNNTGKTYVLRRLIEDVGIKASYLGPARFANFNLLTPFSPQPNRKEEQWRNFLRQLQQETQNIDNSPLNLQQAIAELSDARRLSLFGLLRDMVGSEPSIKYTIEGNSMSQQYIEVDGYNLSFTSSGYRLIATLLTALLDPAYTHFLIDEPELGVSPETQGDLADWLLRDPRGEHFSHISSLILTTHSPVFLDRKNIENNIYVDRIGTQITLRRLESIQDITTLQFRLLGNRFETLFLPAAIILVEGKTDHAYLARLLSLRFPSAAISVINCTTDSRMRDVMAIARQMLGDIRRGPYADRFFAVIDSRHGQGLPDQLEQLGIPKPNVIVWARNGIEFVYPSSLLIARYGGDGTVTVDGDAVTINSHVVTKADLAAYVANTLRGDEVLPEELVAKLIAPLSSLLF